MKTRRSKKPSTKLPSSSLKHEEDFEEMRLNKYIAHAGICARRKADEHIKNGKVTVNGTTVYEMGFKVKPKDEVRFNGKVIKPIIKKVYILFNKPKNVISTTQDPQGRKTVTDYIRNVNAERMYPVGRLDRNTTGLLLLTNDGDLAQKLSHPKYEVRKLYHVELDKNLSKRDLQRIQEGVELEEGIAQVDAASYVMGRAKNCVGVQLHIGWNRIVRRIFETLGYKVEKLDRVVYANLTKKDLPRAKWRYLNDEEIIILKHRNIK